MEHIINYLPLLEKVASILNHSDISVTLEYYSEPQRLRNMANDIEYKDSVKREFNALLESLREKPANFK